MALWSSPIHFDVSSKWWLNGNSKDTTKMYSPFLITHCTHFTLYLEKFLSGWNTVSNYKQIFHAVELSNWNKGNHQRRQRHKRLNANIFFLITKFIWCTLWSTHKPLVGFVFSFPFSLHLLHIIKIELWNYALHWNRSTYNIIQYKIHINMTKHLLF